MDSRAAAAAYDAFEYPGHAFSHTHPARIAAIARLHGLDPPPPERCRVLGLGCGDGVDLLSMATCLPGSEFLGIDLSPPGVGKGRALAAEAGLRNVDLRVLDVMEVGPSLGAFDYVIAHGLYSWVPDAVKEGVLAACSGNLSPRGVAFVSYNAFPGSHVRRMVREMLLFHAGGIPEPERRVRGAAGLLRFLAEHQTSGGPFGDLLRSCLEDTRGMAEASLLHDDMGPVNDPLYFRDFAAAAGRAGLRYLAEAEYPTGRLEAFPPAAVRTLQALSGGDRVLREQYADFLRVRRFRQTLLVHGGAEPTPDPDPARVRGLFAATDAEPVSLPVDLGPESRAEFRHPLHGTIALGGTLPKAALAALAAAAPAWLSFDEVLAAARRAAGREEGADAAEDAAEVAGLLVHGFSLGLLDLSALRPPVAAAAGERPFAAPLSRVLSGSREFVPNLAHREARLRDPLLKALLRLLDGTRDRAALLRDLAAAVAREGIDAGPGSAPGAGPWPGDLEEGLRRIARAGLLRA